MILKLTGTEIRTATSPIFKHWNTCFESLYPAWSMDMHGYVLCFCIVLFLVGSGLAMGRQSFQRILQISKRLVIHK
jgi:hypothetical protein